MCGFAGLRIISICLEFTFATLRLLRAVWCSAQKPDKRLIGSCVTNSNVSNAVTMMLWLTRVRGMVTTQRQRSDTARFPMNTFLAVLMSGDRRMVASTRQLPVHPTTYKYFKMCNKYYLILLYLCDISSYYLLFLSYYFQGFSQADLCARPGQQWTVYFVVKINQVRGKF